ncbi:AbiH family protein [Psychrobacillus psychrotolerans]|uniref:AbiH family protein n=1 Tax=Psychrobacillus psychrotolerans TaxID=126156 RepID=UPI003B0153F8
MDNLNKIEEFIVSEEFIIDKKVNSNSKNIVVIGNGFDMSLGLKSSYQNFIEYIKHKKKFDKDYELYNYNRLFLRKYENFDLNWSDFESLYEEAVRKVNNRSQKNEEPQDILDIMSINNAIKRLEEDFTEYLLEQYPKWIEQRTTPLGNSGFNKFTEDINPFIEKLIKDENTYFINFNYTNSLKNLCESILYDLDSIKDSNERLKKAYDRIFHIHGSVEAENILFGGGFTDSEDINKLHYSKSLINDKLFRIKENESLNTTRKQIMSIVNSSDEHSENNLFIIGHSLQGSDFLFLSKLIKTLDKVYILYYEDDYIFKMEEILRKLGSDIAEKIVLVPFLEVLLQKNKLIISNYEEYQRVAACFLSRFPNEAILSELALTMDHFSFHHMNELRITSDNVDIIIQIVEGLVINRNIQKISRIYFELLSIEEFHKLSKSKDFLMVLKSVEKISFYNTEIDSDFFVDMLENGIKLTSITMEECTLVDGENKVDISQCESLKKLEIVDCSFTSNMKNKQKSMFYITSNKPNNIEKLIILRNSNIILERDVFEKSISLIELNIAITSEESTYSEVVHLKNLEILQMDYTSSGKVPSLTVGNKIREVNLLGYPDEYIKLSAFLKNNNTSIGFPNLKLFHLKTPDQMNSCQNIIVDVILDVFSNHTKFIVDKDIKWIQEYYLEQNNQHRKMINNFEESVDDSILSEFENLYLELSRLKKYSILDEFFEEINKKLNEEIQRINQIKNKVSDEDDTDVKNQEVSQKSTANKRWEPGNELLYACATGDKTAFGKFGNILKEQNKNKIVISVYNELLSKLSNITINSEEDILKLKNDSFLQARDKIIKDFSKEWFVEEKELYLSAIQYIHEVEDIPNIGSIIDSRDYKKYKIKYSEINKFKYPQVIKQNWKNVLDEKIIYLNAELE